MSVRSLRPSLLFVLLVSLLYPVEHALAQVDQMLPPIGGSHGGHFTARCASDEVLNGFELRAADDVDWIRAICARPESPTSIGPRNLHATAAGGPGGQVMQIVCPDNTPAIAGLMIGYEGLSTTIVNNIRLYCATAAINQLPAEFPTAGFDGIPVPEPSGGFYSGLALEMQRCPQGLVPVGINGRAGKWLDALGLVCGALPMQAAALPRPAAPAKPKLTASTTAPFRILVEWMRPVPANNIEWYTIEQLKGQRWVALPMRFDAQRFAGFVEYPDVRETTPREAFRVCAENAAQRACSPEAMYYNFARTQAELNSRNTPAAVTPPRPVEVRPGTAIGPARATTATAATNYSTQSATMQTASTAPAGLPDLAALAARGAALAAQDPLAAELRNRTPNDAVRRGFDVGFAIWEGNTAPGPGKQRVRDALSLPEQPGFDTAAAFALPRNKYATRAQAGAAIGNANPVLASARNAENDVFYWLGFDIASGIFGDPKAGALGNTALGPGSLAIRNELNASGQRGFDAAAALHLPR